jgi:hypothetical protein
MRGRNTRNEGRRIDGTRHEQNMDEEKVEEKTKKRMSKLICHVKNNL